MDTEIILQHGWAFDASSWTSWARVLRNNADVLIAERGYFGARKSIPTFSDNATRKIIIAHSFGAHLLAPEALRQCDTLVLINGFKSLSQNSRAIRAMLKKFPVNPEQVILDFWSNCYSPEGDGLKFLPPPGMNETALEDDLSSMLESELDVSALTAIPQVVLLYGGADRIVPAASVAELTGSLPQAQLIDISRACHVVHLTQTDKCLQLVSDLVIRNQPETCPTQKS